MSRNEKSESKSKSAKHVEEIAEQQIGQFVTFTAQVKTFEKRIYTLVASSFVFSAIASVVNAVALKSNPAFAALTILVGTIGGIGAILLTFSGWAQHPMDEQRFTLDFRASKFGWRLSAWFVASILGLFSYYLLARADSLASVLVMPIATFCFFRGLTLGTLIARLIDQQQILWQSLPIENRDEIAQAERELRKRREEYAALAVKTVQEGQKDMAELQDLMKKFEKDKIRRRHERRVQRIKSLLGRTRRLWENARFKLGGNLLLTQREQTDRQVKRIQLEQMFKEFRAKSLRELYLKITSGALAPFRIEGTDIDLYRDGGWHYVVLPHPTLEARAHSLVEALNGFRDPETGKMKAVRAFRVEPGEVSNEARSLLDESGIVLIGAGDGLPV